IVEIPLADLQLAAELGKTLLERNKELETLIKDYKVKDNEQEREILHLRKHINAMTEVNDSRLKVYEQLEVGIQELERANQRLNLEKNRDKKQIKTLTTNTETLEARCEELSQLLSDTRQSLTIERRNVDKLKQERQGISPMTPLSPLIFGDPRNLSLNTTKELEVSKIEVASVANSTGVEDPPTPCNDAMTAISLCEKVAGKCGEESDELVKLINEMELLKRDFLIEQQRCTELEEQLVSISKLCPAQGSINKPNFYHFPLAVQENQELQSRLGQTSANEELISMHEELSLLDDVRWVCSHTILCVRAILFHGTSLLRQGQMCSRCLRDTDECMTNMDEQSSVAPTEEIYEDDDRSSIMGLANPSAIERPNNLYKETYPKLIDFKLSKIDNGNPYNDLIEKYEALLEVQRTSSFLAKKQCSEATNGAVEASADKKEEDVGKTVVISREQGRHSTEFSETETSSSGFSDETGNKYTQTDERPSFFLCSISNGKDCKFSIYDDVSPIECHFRNRPEYKELFKEIFGVLKKAAESNEGDGDDKLPSLDDDAHMLGKFPLTNAKVPPVTPTMEEPSEGFNDETQSIASSVVSSQSIAISECVTKLERKTAKLHLNDIKKQNKNKSSRQINTTPSGYRGSMNPIEENGQILTPLKREPLEYLSVGVGIKKKNRRKHRNNGSCGDRLDLTPSQDVHGRPSGHYPHHGQRNENQSGSRRNRHQASTSNGNGNWNGSPMLVYNRNMQAPRSSSGRIIELNGVEFYHNTVSQDLHKLKKLDLSYAEVLRSSEHCEHSHTKSQAHR
ncbi:hypothetical protein KR018_011477, partial [Drosophila ironensis]